MSEPLRHAAGRRNALMRIGAGVGSAAIGHAVGALLSLGLVPFFLRAWGADGYGRWIALNAIISYLGLLDLGGASYVGNLMSMAHARGDEAAVEKALSDGVSLFLCIGA